eukprot:646829-Prymnesium_polylepis.1
MRDASAWVGRAGAGHRLAQRRALRHLGAHYQQNDCADARRRTTVSVKVLLALPTRKMGAARRGRGGAVRRCLARVPLACV